MLACLVSMLHASAIIAPALAGTVSRKQHHDQATASERGVVADRLLTTHLPSSLHRWTCTTALLFLIFLLELISLHISWVSRNIRATS